MQSAPSGDPLALTKVPLRDSPSSTTVQWVSTHSIIACSREMLLSARNRIVASGDRPIVTRWVVSRTC